MAGTGLPTCFILLPAFRKNNVHVLVLSVTAGLFLAWCLEAVSSARIMTALTEPHNNRMLGKKREGKGEKGRERGEKRERSREKGRKDEWW